MKNQNTHRTDAPVRQSSGFDHLERTIGTKFNSEMSSELFTAVPKKQSDVPHKLDGISQDGLRGGAVGTLLHKMETGMTIAAKDVLKLHGVGSHVVNAMEKCIHSTAKEGLKPLSLNSKELEQGVKHFAKTAAREAKHEGIDVGLKLQHKLEKHLGEKFGREAKDIAHAMGTVVGNQLDSLTHEQVQKIKKAVIHVVEAAAIGAIKETAKILVRLLTHHDGSQKPSEAPSPQAPKQQAMVETTYNPRGDNDSSYKIGKTGNQVTQVTDSAGTVKHVERNASGDVTKVTEDMAGGGKRTIEQKNGKWQVTDEKGNVTQLAGAPSVNDKGEVNYKTSQGNYVTEKPDGATITRDSSGKITSEKIRNKDGTYTNMEFGYQDSPDGKPTSIRIHDASGEWEFDRMGNWPFNGYKNDWSVRHNGESTPIPYDPTGTAQKIPGVTGGRTDVVVDQNTGDVSYSNGVGKSWNYHTDGSVDIHDVVWGDTHLSRSDRPATPNY